MAIIDLSQEIYDGMPVYLGDTPTALKQLRTMQQDSFVGYQLTCNMHIGTHLDAPLHLLGEGVTVSDIALEYCRGRAICLDVRGQQEFGIDFELPSEVSVVLFFTGWDKFYGTSDYYIRHPQLSFEAVNILQNRGIKLVGFDTPSPDMLPFRVHK